MQTQLEKLPAEASAVKDSAPLLRPGLRERRRPGRIGNPSPHLIPLMRTMDPDQLAEQDRLMNMPNPRAAFHAAILGLVLAVPIWAVLAVVVRLIL